MNFDHFTLHRFFFHALNQNKEANTSNQSVMQQQSQI